MSTILMIFGGATFVFLSIGLFFIIKDDGVENLGIPPTLLYLLSFFIFATGYIGGQL